ncbi:MAG: response regulator [Anaerolineae bacterium]|nr:response regulator [Anaerolineae bacterium]
MITPHILIVDDEPGILDASSRALRRQGFEVTTASDAQTARILLQSKTVDMLISDIRMPGESGISLLQAVRETNPDLPLMIITAYPDSKYIDAAIDLNVKGFIPKPFNLSDLISEVKRNLGIKESAPVAESSQDTLSDLVQAFIEELKRHQVPVLEGTVQRDAQQQGRAVLIPTGSREGQIPIDEWLLDYTKGEPAYLIVIPRP